MPLDPLECMEKLRTEKDEIMAFMDYFVELRKGTRQGEVVGTLYKILPDLVSPLNEGSVKIENWAPSLVRVSCGHVRSAPGWPV